MAALQMSEEHKTSRAMAESPPADPAFDREPPGLEAAPTVIGRAPS
jgi:hypothetical protein